MSSVLNSGAEAFTARALFGGALPESTSRNVLNEFAEFAHGSFNHGGYRDVTEREPGLGGRNYAILGTVIFGLHLAAFWAYINTPSTPYVQPTKHEVLIEFAKPVVPPPPPPVIEPPKPPPPPPPKAQRTPPPPQPQALRTPPADAVIAADDIVVQENTTAPVSTGPVVADAAPTPPAPPAPAPPKEEPITEAFGGAGYLNNPNPEYPPAAERQGLTGKVLLRVRVLPDGSVGGVEVKKSSGHKILDNAAIKAVQGWKFSPSKRGNTPIEGSVNVPIDFQL